MKLLSAIRPAEPAVISIVGGGGKTALAFSLAREYAGQGRRVLVTTTTAMFHPDEVARPALIPYTFDRFFLGPVRDLSQIESGVEPGEILLAARSQKSHKIIGYDPGELKEALPFFDAVIIEADGARMKPLKAPAPHEPVLLPETRTLIACIGLDCLGRPIDASCVHRPEIVRELIGGGREDPVTEAGLIRLAADERGSFKGAGRGMDRVLVFNKADSKALTDQGRDLAGRAKEEIKGLSACLVTCLKDQDAPVKAGWSDFKSQYTTWGGDAV